MAAVTALIQIGNPHPNDGGLRSFSRVQLEEGDRPALIFKSLTREIPPNPTVMIPTIENTLEDALVMIAYVLGLNREITDMVTAARAGHAGNHLEMYEAFDQESRNRLYRLLADPANAKTWPYLGFGVYRDSMLTKQVERLHALPFDYELLLSVRGRRHTHWGPEPKVWDELAGEA